MSVSLSESQLRLGRALVEGRLVSAEKPEPAVAEKPKPGLGKSLGPGP